MSIGFMAVFPWSVRSCNVRMANRVAAIGLCLVFGLRRLRGVRLIDARIDRRGVDGGGVVRKRLIAGAQATLERRCVAGLSDLASASAVYGLVASGIGSLNESILVERGFTPDIHHQVLAVTAITGLPGTSQRRTGRAHVVADGRCRCAARLAAGLIARAHVTTVAQVMVQAVATGIVGGSIMVVSRALGR